MGKPRAYSEKAAGEMCRRIRAGCSLRQLYKLPTMPSQRSFDAWRLQRPELAARCREAFEARARRIAEGGIRATLEGRPTLYTPELADEICERLERGQSIGDMRRAGMPIGPVYAWIKRHPRFRARYTLARMVAAHEAAAELVRLADDDEGDCIEVDGRLVAHPTRLKRARLRLEARRSAAMQLLPRKYTLEALLAEDAAKTSHEDWLRRLG